MTAAGNVTIPFAYKGECQILRWSETPKGRTVTLLLDPFVGEQHPFKAMKCGENGSRMQIAAVLVDDQDQPAVPPTKRNGPVASVTADAPAQAPMRTNAQDQDARHTPFRELKKAAQAALKLQDETFKAWLVDTYWTGKEEIGDYDGLLKRALDITSKKELDGNPYKGKLWDELLTSFDYRAHT